MESVVGPRVSPQEFRAHRWRYLLPSGLLLLAAGLLTYSFFLPYWGMKLYAPQYPKGLKVVAYLNRLEGDVREIDGLNHYIGMRPLNEAAQLERHASALLVGVLALLLCAAIFIHSPWAAVVALPAVLWPAGFLIDLHLWMAHFGTNLDPAAALSSSIKPFVPPVLGEGFIGQFRTVAKPGDGLLLSAVAAAVVLVALWFHRAAYRPLLLARRRAAAAARAGAIGAALLLACRLAEADARGAGGFDPQAAVYAAQAGDTVTIPPGRYAAPLLIDRPLTVVGQPGAVLDAAGEGDIVHISAPDVTLRGLVLRGSGDSLDRENCGILVSRPRATIEDCVLEDVLVGMILRDADESVVRGNTLRGKPLSPGRRGDGLRLWNSHACRLERNVIDGVRDVVVWYSRGTHIVGNLVCNGRYGLHFMYAYDSVVEENELRDNSVGVYLMYSRGVAVRRNLMLRNRGPSGYGLGLKDMDDVVIEENVVAANRVGLYVDGAQLRVDTRGEIRRNVVAYNDIALALLPSARRNHFTDNTFLENIEQVAILGGGAVVDNAFAVDGRGNYWSDYVGYDAGGDGIGDVPYRAMSLFENLIDREPKLRLFLYSPAQQAIELASRAFPIVRPQPKIVDEAPLMRPLEIATMTVPSHADWSLSATGGALLALGTLAWRRRTADRAGAAGPAGAPVPHAPGTPTPDAARQSAAVPTSGDSVMMLSLRGVRKEFGRYAAVADVDLDVTPGSSVALWGENGAGKTTLIKCVLGLHRCHGELRVAGIDARRQGKSARRLIGHVAQEFALADDASTRETVAFFARLKRVPVSQADVVLERVGLAPQSAKRVRALSGGMKQRLALAIALLGDPPLLLLDEPTSNLDARARRQFLELLAGLRAAGKTIVFTTHRPEEVALVADRVVVLERGKVVADLPPGEFLAQRTPRCTLRIPLAASDWGVAVAALRTAGFKVETNCRALLVEVSATRKAEPLRVLAEAGCAVVDFEVESEAAGVDESA